VETLDLSQTTWPGLPHHNIANVITFVARRGMQTYPNARQFELRYELADRHGVPPERLTSASMRSLRRSNARLPYCSSPLSSCGRPPKLTRPITWRFERLPPSLASHSW
jgi:hypothetical protein